MHLLLQVVDLRGKPAFLSEQRSTFPKLDCIILNAFLLDEQDVFHTIRGGSGHFLEPSEQDGNVMARCHKPVSVLLQPPLA